MKGIKRGRVAVVILGSHYMIVGPDDATQEEIAAAVLAEEELELFRRCAHLN